MKKPIALSSNDWHLKRSNVDDVIRLVEDQCQLAKIHELSTIICLGDVFDSRVSQRMDVLIAFFQILEICKKYDIKLVCIPGNHDKTDYEAEESFLKPFSFHPNLYLIEDYAIISIDKYRFHFIPYFAENTVYLNYLSRIKYQYNDVLFSHVAVQGSRNNDGTVIDNNLKLSSFDKFDAVFLGHYHNHQIIGRNIYHLPSIQQNNFGEDDNKGYTLLYDDLSFQIVKSRSKTYTTIKIDLDNYDFHKLNSMVESCDLQSSYYRLLLTGTKEQLKSIDIAALTEKGFVIQNKENDIMANVNAVKETEVTKYDLDGIVKLFQQFCKEKNINYQIGINYLNEIIYHAS